MKPTEKISDESRHQVTAENKHYTVWGPDGFPISPVPAVGIHGVLHQMHHLLRMVEHQGYYLDSHWNKLTPADLIDSIRIEEQDMVVNTTMAYTMYIQDNLERIERGGWAPVSYNEFLDSEECSNLTDIDEQETLPGKDESDWTYFGEVGVDSGQLMVCDPHYIENRWEKESDSEESSVIAKGWQHKDGTVLYCELHGSAPTPDAVGFHNFDQLIPMYRQTVNQMNASGDTKEMPRDRLNEGKFSYAGCCDATVEDPNFGQMNFHNGISGAGVAFSSGFGDGLYDVYGKIKDYDDFGPRIAEVRIVMIGDDDE